MIGGVKDIDWGDMAEGGPAFITILMIPFTFNVGHGLLAGLMASLVCYLGRRLRPWYARNCSCSVSGETAVQTAYYGPNDETVKHTQV